MQVDHALYVMPMLQPSFDVMEEEQLLTLKLALDVIANLLGLELIVEPVELVTVDVEL